MRRVLALLALLLGFGGASAQMFPEPIAPRWGASLAMGCGYGGAVQVAEATTPALVCQAFLSKAQQAGCVATTTFNSYGLNMTGNTTFSCTINATPTSSTFSLNGKAVCFPDRVLNETTGMCDARCALGTTWNNTTKQCVSDDQECAARAGKTGGAGWRWDTGVDSSQLAPPSVPTRSVCDETAPTASGKFCTLTLSDPFMGFAQTSHTGTGETWWWMYQASSYTGAECTPGQNGTQPSGETHESDLPAGKCEGTVNGQTVIYDCAKTTETGEKKTTPPVTDSETTPNTNGDPPGTTTTNTTISCSGANSCTKTTVTTVVNNDGTKTTTTKTESGDKTSMCQGTVGLKTCEGTGGDNGTGEGGSAFGGTCNTKFDCDGDAILCAAAKGIHEQKCIFEKESAESELYEQHKNDGNETGMDTDTKTLGPGDFDTSDAIGGAGCIADKNVTVWGQSVTLPFSVVCDSLAMFGNLLVAVSFLLAIRIVGRG
jgi:hypothetical protein